MSKLTNRWFTKGLIQSDMYMCTDRINKEIMRWSPQDGTTITIKSIFLPILYLNLILRWGEKNVLWGVNLVNVKDF